MDVFETFPRLETEHFELREITLADSEALFQIFSDPETMKYWSCLPYTSIDEAKKLIALISLGFAGKQSIEWGVALKGHDTVIGKCSFHRWQMDHFRGEMGYVLLREHWGKGILKEVLPVLIRFGFERMGLHSIEAQVDPGNMASRKLLDRLGFTQEGHLKENFFLNGKFYDTVIYSLVRTNENR